MLNRPLQAVVGLDGALLTELLSEALAGRGPALLPIAADTPPPRVRALLEAMRPATVRTPEGVTGVAGGAGIADDTALVIATSGSTGTPKGVELSARALLHSARASIERIGAGPGDAWLCALPTSHISGLQVIVRALAAGTEPIHRRFDAADTMAVAARHRAHVSLVPTQLRRLLAAGADLSLFGTIVLGGAAADEGLLEAARAAGGRVVTTYGMSETCGGCVYDGVALDGVTAGIGDDGRVLLAGPVLFSGYRLRPDLTAEHLRDEGGRRWFRTGDLGRLDGEGRLRVRGRVDDVINTGGHKVVAGEVAALLNRLGSVAEAAVVGRPDPEWGQRVTAVVVPTAGDAPPSLAELRSWVRAHLPAYAAPRELDLRPALPLLASGKPDLQALRSPAAAGRGE
ncbi:O-succinylbenzoic acid--CoA ligase [Spinactinospora alkalitolerans]|uniref:O-succinylbenzoic acid--CoA ligase n=1 Tax=Spinactinospora alkalitolerans TaxID=687207 RepID=A0A852TZ40_9ACTN|nr:AMP-binding protein [Spinactinospora alkalitolerans]NYE48282.1 O-succinylbenzoic acid--CoA ligase [Spinactinospora alkalitolerans]